MPHGRHIYAKSAETAMDKMCAYPTHQHELPHCNCVLRGCSNLPHIDLIDQESDRHNYIASTSTCFHIYHLIVWCTVHGINPLDERKFFCLCFQYMATVIPEKLYTRKEFVMMDKYIADFCTSFYITEIQNIAFHLPHIRIIGTNHCGNTHHEALKYHITKQDVLCCCDYTERVVAIFHTKYSLNTMEEIYLSLLKDFNWNTLLHQQRKKNKEHDKNTHVMLCLIIFFLMK